MTETDAQRHFVSVMRDILADNDRDRKGEQLLEDIRTAFDTDDLFHPDIIRQSEFLHKLRDALVSYGVTIEDSGMTRNLVSVRVARTLHKDELSQN